jgi:hypothetical protein
VALKLMLCFPVPFESRVLPGPRSALMFHAKRVFSCVAVLT